MTEPYQLSAVEAASRIAGGTLTSEDLVRSCLERIEAREGQIQAWEFLDPDLAVAQARRADRVPAKGQLHGLPVGIKDILDTADMPTAWGASDLFGERRPERNAPAVQRLREEGAVLLGKTAISRFGFWLPGKTRNPHNPAHTPGSSSSGSAAAVAAYMCPLALGAQTEGSIMRPAAFCGIVGLRPTHDWIPWREARNYAPSLDVVGGLTRSVDDMILFMRGLTGNPAFKVDAADEARLRIGLYRTADWTSAPDYTRAIFEETAEVLGRAGCDIRDVDLPPTFAELTESQEIVINYESARSFEWEMTTHENALDAGMRELLDRGKTGTRERYLAARTHGETCRDAFADVIGDVDPLMVPGALGEPPEFTDTGHNEFIAMWMLLHVPNLALPVGTGPTGLPIGIQLIGRRGDDAQHLARARRIEAILGDFGWLGAPARPTPP